jgi:hypothetical protein
MYINFFRFVDSKYYEVNPQQEQQFLYVTTKGWKTGRQHRIEIWFISYADKYYVVSERKEKAWVQNIMHDQRVHNLNGQEQKK